MGYVDPIHEPVVVEPRLQARLIEDAVVTYGARLHPYQLGVLELDEEARPLAEVSPYGVVDDLCVGRALLLQCLGARLQLQYEAVLVVDHLLPDAHRVQE